MSDKKIKIAIAGLGNCASSLIQGLEFYKDVDSNDELVPGLMHNIVGDYKISDIEVVAVFDIDERKVGKDFAEAIFEKPNNTITFCKDVPKTGVLVQRGPTLDGFADHMHEYPEDQRFIESDKEVCDVKQVLKDSGAQMLVNYMPVGSQEATEFYANACLEAGIGFINAMPVFICSKKEWADKFEEKGLPCLGDDIKAQVGATITHRTLAHLYSERGVTLDRSYQLNVGGNTDFLNMLERKRLSSKKESKTEAVEAELSKRLDYNNLHIGPSDYVPFLKDNKICYLRMEGRKFGNVPTYIELKLSVEDSPNSAGVIIDAVRMMKLALDRGTAGPLLSPSAYFMKHPMQQITDDKARAMVEEFILNKRER